MITTINERLTFPARLERLRAIKMQQTRAKREIKGAMDHDDQGMVLPPLERAAIVEVVGGSGVRVREAILKDFTPRANHASGGFFGPRACGENFRRLLELHPTYLQPLNSMAGVYMVSFLSYRNPSWNPDFDASHLAPELERYGIDSGIGGVQHFCPDLRIGLDLGWGGLLEKVRHFRAANPRSSDFYDGLEAVILGVQDWIGRHAADARRMAETQEHPDLRANLEQIAAICARLVSHAPRTFREACQWLVFFQAVAKMYNASGEWGRLDELLRPYYERDTAAGMLRDEEAVFHLACLLLSETAYIQLGGPDAAGRDQASRVSFLILEAVHQLRIPANIALRVHEGMNEDLFRRAIEILLTDKMGFPKFLGDAPLNEGFLRNGYPVELARQRIYAGCHWTAIPGREYGMCDLIKIDFAKVFDAAWRDLMDSAAEAPGIARLWALFEAHLRRAVAVTAEGIDFHLAHMHEVFPELVLDLFCYGPVEQGLDASHGGVEFYNIGVDGASMATVADSFAALEQRVEIEGRFSWREIDALLKSDWAGPEGEAARRMMRNIRRFGSGGSPADHWAQRISQTFARQVKEAPTPAGRTMIPGLFSWARVIDFGRRLGATPNGRRAGTPVSHGPNPDPGFNAGKPGPPTQLAAAVAAVQTGYGNACPLQLDLDPHLADDDEAVEIIGALIRTHFELGGTMVNINVMTRETLLEAFADPARHPDLIVRVTGFSAFFASLSDELRQYVVDRIV